MTEPHDDVHDEDPHNPGLKQNKAERQSPGELLREGRQAHDYSIEDLCAQTKLSAWTVQSLEDNDFDALSQPVFARGYYRQCAKVLDLDVERVMAAYTAWAGDSQAQQGAPATAVHVIPHDVTPGGFRLRGLLIFVLLVLVIGGAAIVLLPSLSSTTDSSSDNEGNTTQVLSDDNDSRNAGDSSDSTAEDADSPSAGASNSLSTSADSGDGSPDTPAVAGKSDDAEARTGQTAGGRNVNETLGITPPDEDGQSADDDGNAQQPSVAPNHLKLVFNKRSWVRVTDGNGNRMASGIFEAGDTQTFDGQPPYHVKLGFAPGVAVTMGGQKVDVAAQTGGSSIANLTLKAPDNNR